jgi:hypothetical protein
MSDRNLDHMSKFFADGQLADEPLQKPEPELPCEGWCGKRTSRRQEIGGESIPLCGDKCCERRLTRYYGQMLPR